MNTFNTINDFTADRFAPTQWESKQWKQATRHRTSSWIGTPQEIGAKYAQRMEN